MKKYLTNNKYYKHNILDHFDILMNFVCLSQKIKAKNSQKQNERPTVFATLLPLEEANF